MSDPSSPWVVLADYKWKLSLSRLAFPPPKGAKGSETKVQNKGRTPEPTRSQGNPSPPENPGAHSVSSTPDHSQHAEQPTASPRSQLCRREVVSDSRECKAAIKGRQGTAAGLTPPEPKQIRCLLTAC